MDVERELSGWKIALNTTEFFCCSDVDQLLRDLSRKLVSGAYIQGVVMADRPETKDRPLSQSLPLVTQRTDGYYESDFPTGVDGSLARSRLLHRRADGAYHVGRHTSFRYRIVRHPPQALVLWYAFSPWTPQTVARKVQIQQRIPGMEKSGRGGAAVFGSQHLVDEAQLNATWKEAAGNARDLSQDACFRGVVARREACRAAAYTRRQPTESSRESQDWTRLAGAAAPSAAARVGSRKPCKRL